MEKWLPTAEYLRECFAYDPATGALTWKTRPLHHFVDAHAQAAWNGRYAGKKAGAITGHGCLNVAVGNVKYLTHRLIWFMQTGRWPAGIDHKNRDPGDNRWENLREATQQQNMWNSAYAGKRGRLPRGVKLSRSTGRYRAVLQGLNGRVRTEVPLGVFDTPEEAHTVWLEAARKQREQFFHLG